MTEVTIQEQLSVISQIKWSTDHPALLSQARIFQENETQRLRTTTLKVQIYLGVLIAIPAATASLLRLRGGAVEADVSIAGFVFILILIISTIFWMRALWFGRKALSVGVYNFMDVEDFKEASEATKPSSILISKVLQVAVLNQSMHNRKITSLRKMETSIFKLVATLSVGIVITLGMALWPYVLVGLKSVECNCF